jgi:uncharacterized RDD family membrane protein YckC
VSCPACGQALDRQRERCPACGALIAPAAEGALAPVPSAVTPSARGREASARDLGAMKKRERTWQDEVKDRIRHRRQRRAGGAELPLFNDEEPAAALAEPPREPVAPEAPVRAPEIREPPARRVAEVHGEPGDGPLAEETTLFSPTEGELQDLPLRPTEAVEESREPERDPAPRRARVEIDPPMDEEYGTEDEPRAGAEEWLELPPKPPEARPVERPALPQERLQAAVVDLALLVVLWTVVVYFASRAAHVSLASLRPSWPWLLAYLAFLGLVYASYFTGTTGQTLGKMVTGLRVLHASSRPPGYLRAFLRAGAGALGILSVGLGQLPMMFDPARRALHDRLFGTRVVKH